MFVGTTENQKFWELWAKIKRREKWLYTIYILERDWISRRANVDEWLRTENKYSIALGQNTFSSSSSSASKSILQVFPRREKQVRDVGSDALSLHLYATFIGHLWHFDFWTSHVSSFIIPRIKSDVKWPDGQTGDGWMDRRMDRWVDGRTDVQTQIPSCIEMPECN